MTLKPITNNMTHTLRVRAQGLRDNRSIHQCQVADLIDAGADVIEAKSARIEMLEAALKSARVAIVDAQGEWAGVSIAYCPERIEPLREAEEDIDEVLTSTDAAGVRNVYANQYEGLPRLRF